LVALYPLSTLPKALYPEVGGKALPLVELQQRGLPVPPAYVIPAPVFRAYRDDDAISPHWEAYLEEPSAQTAAKLRQAIINAPLAPELERELRKCVAYLGGSVAVRSSALAEDSAERSFAGQHHTELAVGAERISAAVRRCWASLYAEAVIAYRREPIGPSAAMAVLVQALIEPAVSGVLFTTNPLNGSWREMVVEATWGLGETLVSGQVSPHWYLVRRPRKSPSSLQRVIARVRLDVLQEDLPNIPVYLVRDGEELLETETPLRLSGRRTLEREQLFKLCRMGLRVESMMGDPRDIEWCLDHDGHFHLLQARPITAKASLPPRKDILWTRRFIGERWPEPATPMGWSILAPILDWFIGYPRTQRRYLGGGPSVRLVDGHPYINATIFRHLLFKTPGTPPPRFLLDMIPPDEELTWRNRFSSRPSFNVYGSIIRETVSERRWQRFVWSPLTNHKRWDRFRDKLIAEQSSLNRESRSASAALEQLQLHESWIRDYVKIHVISLLYANLFYQSLESTVTAILPEQAHNILEALATPSKQNRTVEANHQLWDLAQLLSQAERKMLDEGKIPTEQSPFTERFSEFLDQYGHRASASWEIFSPRWRDQPEILAPLLLAQTGEGPTARQLRQKEQTKHALKQMKAAVGWGPKRLAFTTLLKLTQRYLLLRENQRFWFDHLLYATQKNLLQLGDILHRRGHLADPTDIAFLTIDEARGLTRGALIPEDAAEWVARRREAHREAFTRVPPVFLQGDEGVSLKLAKGRLEGLGISTGRARGTARLIHRLSDAGRLQPGDILVTRTVDPGWTPLFEHAAGVVLELGSILSHGAVVAREYGVPAVVNIDDVTSRITDGQEITVDGNRGLVWVHS
jgi:phosphohistidine swiveling domain-containing protein